ncbi:uncharacterized protein CTRU02_210426 [Colletotrichum truncatum]|uniref:Uncharacterized protein n=1 Tax=Colletotrichum truncatum TaxID=5467 RepID=A0ACC3YP77_COLTU|nr:uncharacterized protein CTRU02_13972 [Colletotrichum truncatum]KAF6782815.1 hypothetical protein CTRU02_13972 [Colletotrichum truncatum]
MGNDGGSIPKRRELVKEAARALTVSELKANALESLGHAWTHDALTNEPLDKENVVSDWRGRLYNYETILKSLLPSDDTTASPPTTPESPELTFSSTGIKSLRDIVKLKFHQYTPPSKKAIWACPISLKELGPGVKAVYLVPCGHVFAEVAIKEIQESSCPECSEPFTSENVVPILPSEEGDMKKLVQRMDDLIASGLTHSLKKDKKAGGKKKRKAEGDSKEDRNGDAPEKRRATDDAKATKKEASAGRISGINNPMAASLTAKVMAEQEELSKRRKIASKA